MIRNCKYIFTFFILVIGINILVPIDFDDLLEGGITLELDMDRDSEENDSEENESEKEVEGEEYFLESDPFAMNSSLTSLIISDFRSIRMRIYLDIETPPPLT